MSDISDIYNLYTESTRRSKPYSRTDIYGNTLWFIRKNVLHREDGPAIEGFNGSKEWYRNGERHREDGPAVEWSDGTKEWWLDGERTREDGPALEWPNGIRTWCLDGAIYRNMDNWAQAVLKKHGKPHDEQAVQDFLRSILKKDMEDAL